MTNRDFLNAVLNANINVEVNDFATAELAKLDKRNEKRRNTLTKEQKENMAIKDSILAVLSAKPIPASAVAAEVGISTQKASALLRQLVSDNFAAVADEKVKGKGTVKVYSLPVVETDEGETEADENETEDEEA